MIKILIGGSPCTYWSVAQKKGREVEAEGLGWEPVSYTHLTLPTILLV